MEISLSAPFLLDEAYKPHKWVKESSNKENTALLLNSARLIQDYKESEEQGVNYSLYVADTKSGETYFLYDLEDQISVYVAEIEKNQFIKPLHSAVCQVSIWRDKGAVGVMNVAPYIFWNILYKRYGSIISDSIQSDDGKAFWLRRVDEAKHRGLVVAVVDLTPDLKIMKLFAFVSGQDWLKRNAKRVWGTDDQHTHRRLLIADKNLYLPLGIPENEPS
jgi:hypothetical protein